MFAARAVEARHGSPKEATASGGHPLDTRRFVFEEVISRLREAGAAGLGKLSRTGTPALMVFEGGGRLLFSTRPELEKGRDFGQWQVAEGKSLKELIGETAQHPEIAWKGRPQKVRGWPESSGEMLFVQVAGTPYFVMAYRAGGAQQPTRPLLSKEAWLLLLEGAVAAGLMAGMILVVGSAMLRGLRKDFAQGLLQAALAIADAHKAGTAIKRSGVRCAELALLSDELDRKNALTSRPQSEKTITRAEKTVREVLNSIYDAVVVLDDQLKMIWVNRRMEQMFQISRRDVPQLGLADFASEPGAAEQIVEGIGAARDGVPRIFECRARRMDNGQEFPVEIYAQKVVLPGAEILCASIRDISAAKAAEKALGEAKDAADFANRAKGEFLARMSHEIRTPMNAILGLAYLSSRSTTDRKAASVFERIHHSGLGLLRILNDILDISKLESGKVDILDEPFCPQELIGVVSDLAAVRMSGKALRFLPLADPGVPGRLRGDSFRIQQVLTNLIENAIKFTAEGSISMGMSYEAESSLLRFEVADQGIGITPEQQSRLFQTFEQADGTTTRRYGGSGLGLAICKKLVELMGGGIRVSSEQGKGAVFSFEVRCPVCVDASHSDTASKPADSPARLKGVRVLVVDDMEINREIAGEMIREAGCVVGFAGGGREAIGMVRDGDWDLVALDLEMPEVDGFATARAIRALADSRKAAVPIVAMSAHAFQEFRLRAIDAGMNGYVMKPVDVGVLHAELLRALGESTAAPTAQPSSPDAEAPGSVAVEPVAIEPAVLRLGGNMRLYSRMVDKFLVEWEGVDGRIERLVGEDPAEARRLAHSLKGLAGTLGAGPLSQAAAGLEQSLISGGGGPAVSEPLSRVGKALIEVVEFLRSSRERGRFELPPGQSRAEDDAA